MSLTNPGPQPALKKRGAVDPRPRPEEYRTSRSFLVPSWGAGRDPAPAEKPAPAAEPALVEAVRKAFDLDALEARCRRSVDQLLGPQTKEGRYKHIDNGSPVLAVAHCDVVPGLPEWFAASRKQLDGDVVFSPALDDRLGVYTILDLLPKLGITVDVLLTDDEERARSTADLFVPNKEYNWGVEFDRRGKDAVCYQYKDMESVAARYFHVGQGTFSDISSLQAGCLCLNIGVGYIDEHTETCRCLLEVYFQQIARFLAMYRDLATTAMPYDAGDADNADESLTRRFDDYPFYDPAKRGIEPDELDDKMDEEYFDLALREGVCPYCDEILERGVDCPGCGRSYVPQGKSFSIAAKV